MANYPLLNKIPFDKIPSIFRNLFFLTGVTYVVWMLFLDDNNMISQYRLRNELKGMNEKMVYYQVEAQKAETEYNSLMNDPAYAIRFARKKYWMKKSNEDVFVVLSPTKK